VALNFSRVETAPQRGRGQLGEQSADLSTKEPGEGPFGYTNGGGESADPKIGFE
jgi:hypothetical protein